jgi:uncharacterized membrane protein
MSNLPLHPAIVHLPLGVALVVPFVAAGLAWAVWRDRLPRSSFAILVALQLLVVAGGLVAMWLGERDARRVEPVVGEAAVDTHEERAELFLWAAGAVLAGAAVLLVVPRGRAPAAAALVTAGAIGVALLGVRAGEAGGELVYRRGAAAAFQEGASREAAAVPATHREGRD